MHLCKKKNCWGFALEVLMPRSIAVSIQCFSSQSSDEKGCIHQMARKKVSHSIHFLNVFGPFQNRYLTTKEVQMKKKKKKKSAGSATQSAAI